MEPGFCSCAHWLSYHAGLNMNSAREKIRVARALAELPLIDDAFREARISYSKVRAITRVANRKTEQTLLEIALCGTAAQLEATVRRYRKGLRSEAIANANARHEARSLNVYWDDDGMLVIRGRFAPEDGAKIERALEAIQFPPRSREASRSNERPHTEAAARPAHPARSRDEIVPVDPPVPSFEHQSVVSGTRGELLELGRKARTVSPAPGSGFRAGARASVSSSPLHRCGPSGTVSAGRRTTRSIGCCRFGRRARRPAGSTGVKAVRTGAGGPVTRSSTA